MTEWAEDITKIGNSLGLEGRFLCEFGFEQIMGVIEENKRKDVLLKAAYDLLQKQDNSSLVLNLLEETTVYDEADCDGYCLMTDIEVELGLPVCWG